jgi:ADP-ribosyl-[dinitrogen reductase] hydrolase
LVTEEAKSRIRGCLYGGAIGDAFGYPVEFSSLRLIQKDYGPDGLTTMHYLDRDLVVSDDTQMTLFTMEGVCRGLEDGADLFEEIRLSYIDWLATQKPFDVAWAPRGEIYHDTRLWHARAPGATCIRAIEAGAFGTPEQPVNDSKGCGGVMRVAPLGLILRWSPEQAFDAAVRAAAMTHGHPLGYLSAGALAYLIRLLISGYWIETAVPLMLSYLHQRPDTEAILSIVQKAVALSKDDQTPVTEAVASLGQGWVAEEALAIAIYAALRGSFYEDVLSIAANHDGDSDSTASIAGQIYGAGSGDKFVLGLSSRNEWTKRLDVAELLEKLLDDFLKIR